MRVDGKLGDWRFFLMNDSALVQFSSKVTEKHHDREEGKVRL
jgi:hypothetical protein